ncbi:MAG: ABC transporter ATP-binding protein [Tannerella sp.]|jgi:ABC-2 type transport system ATP-binding protein|nr:ABC transporter ATP-binding protein [Tannerella sp.]
MLKINDLSKSFDSVEVLNIPRLEIEKGELVGVVGNNGAGKTTLFRLCLDLLKAERGSVFIEGKDVSLSEEWKRQTGAFIDERFLIDFLTPEEYFHFIGGLYGLSKANTDTNLAEFGKFMADTILGHRKKYIEKFSKGNRQKTGIIGAMITHPKLLILDEPFNFLDPSSQIEMKRLLQKFNAEYGATILLSSHNIQYVADICSRIILLDKGKIRRDDRDVTDGTKMELENYFRMQ